MAFIRRRLRFSVLRTSFNFEGISNPNKVALIVIVIGRTWRIVDLDLNLIDSSIVITSIKINLFLVI